MDLPPRCPTEHFLGLQVRQPVQRGLAGAGGQSSRHRGSPRDVAVRVLPLNGKEHAQHQGRQQRRRAKGRVHRVRPDPKHSSTSSGVGGAIASQRARKATTVRIGKQELGQNDASDTVAASEESE